MSKIRILGIVVLIVVIAVIMTTVYNASTYSDFNTAKKNPGKTFQIIGRLDRAKEIFCDSTLDNLSLCFSLIDDNGVSGRVLYYGSMPRDFQKLEEVVVTGYMADTVFIAENLLLKCPSKYTNEQDSMKQYNAKNG